MESKSYVLDKMRDIGLKAAESLQAIAPELDGTAIIDREADIPDFDPEKHQYLNWKKGEVVRDDGQVWQLIQPYDSTIYKDHPNDMRAQWGLCHTKNPLKAKPYVEPLGRSGMYMKGECCIAKDGSVRRSKIDNNVWPPTEYPDGWEIMEI
jgi:hypothetical protein|nr:MAG TPA: hypothetical protein [Caudoviricetes sp.]